MAQPLSQIWRLMTIGSGTRGPKSIITGDTDNEVVIGPDSSMLIVDDDGIFLRRLGRAMEQRGFKVELAETLIEAMLSVRARPPKYGIFDLRLAHGSGLEVIEAIRARRGDSRMIVLTGYGNIANAVNAVKLGAIDYLSKPINADDLMSALLADRAVKAGVAEHPMSAARVAGSTYSGSMRVVIKMSLRLPGAWICTEERCSGSCPSTHLHEVRPCII
jgi:two-component system response regulator RegA